MRILVVGTGQVDSAAMNCSLALSSMGHDVELFDPDQYPTALRPLRRTWRSKIYTNFALRSVGLYDRLFQRTLLETAEHFRPEVVLVIPLFSVETATVERLKRGGAKVAGWFQDAVVNLGSHQFLLADYDGLFFKDPYIVERFRVGAGIQNVHYLPEACEPSRHHPLPLSEADRERFGCDLMVYGNLYAYRARLLEHLVDFDMRFFGPKPPRWMKNPVAERWQGFPIFYEEKIRAVLAAKIVVNSCHYGEVRSTNARVFEVAGIGGFQVADAPSIAEFFEPGVEIATFAGPRELRDVIQHYLSRPEERSAMATRAQQRAHREHTYANRLRTLLAAIGALHDGEHRPEETTHQPRDGSATRQ